MAQLKTRLFEYAKGMGIESDTELADKMGLSPSHVWRVRNKKRAVGPRFQLGAFKAFGEIAPSLFYFEKDEAEVKAS